MLHLISNNILLIAIAVIVLLAVVLFISYVKAPPSNAYIISGLSKEPRVLIGSGGFRIPFFERLDQVYLGQITVDIKTDVSVPTNDFINVDVDAVAKIRVLPTNEGTRLAAKNFLNMRPDQIAEQLQDSLQGNMREIVGTLDLRKLNTDRDGFSDAVMNKAQPDMSKLGIEIISCNIQNVTDKEGLIKDLGADNTAKIKKDAAINRAVAERDIKIAQAKAEKEANDERIEADTAIAIKKNELALKEADLKQQADTAKATADAAYEIQSQEQKKAINTKTVEARFTDYELGMAAAKAEGKPVLVDFTGFGCVNCRKMEASVWTDPQVADLITKDYVLISLYVDDKTPLAEPLTVTDEKGEAKTLRTVGAKWSYLQSHKFGANAQPYYVILDNNGKPLCGSRAYKEDVPEYVQFLQEGLSRYE